MGKLTSELEVSRKAYRDALEAARARPTPEAWAKLLAAGKELSAAQEPRARGRRGRHSSGTAPTLAELEAEPRPEPELGILDRVD